MPSIYQPGLTKLEISPALEGSAGWRRIDRREPRPGTSPSRSSAATLDDALARGRVQADGEMAESLYRRGLGYEHLATKIFMPPGAEEPVYAPYVEHYPPDTHAALAWLARRQPGLWRERQQVGLTGSIEHRLAQMTPEERMRDALELVKRRLAEARM